MSPPYNFPALSKIPKKLFATIHYHFGYLGLVGPRTDGTFPPENWLPLTSSKRRYWYQPRARSYSECGQWKLQLCTLWIQIWKIWEEKMPRQQMNTETHAYHERSETTVWAWNANDHLEKRDPKSGPDSTSHEKQLLFRASIPAMPRHVIM